MANVAKTIEIDGIKNTFNPITIDKVGPQRIPQTDAMGNEVAPIVNTEKWEAQLRQVVTKEYPGRAGSDGIADALFVPEELGGESQSYEEVRVTWIPVPANSTEESILARLNQCEHPKLNKFMSLNVEKLLSSAQKRSMETGLNTLTVADYKERLAIQDGKGNKVLYNGMEQYRTIKFFKSFVEDVDMRSAELKELSSGPAFELAAGQQVNAPEAINA